MSNESRITTLTYRVTFESVRPINKNAQNSYYRFIDILAFEFLITRLSFFLFALSPNGFPVTAKSPSKSK